MNTLTYRYLDRIKRFRYTVTSSWWFRKTRCFGFKYYCPICRSRFKRFLHHSTDPDMTYDSLCPICFSKSPHRRNWLYIDEWISRLKWDSATLLHVAPENSIKSRLENRSNINYIYGDIKPLSGGISFDIAKIPMRNQSLDFVYCCHVLMMIPEKDIQSAIDEIYRVLSFGGKAIVETPLIYGNTREMSHETFEERELSLGTGNVLREIGESDYIHKVSLSGFRLEKFLINNSLVEYGLYQNYVYVLCKDRKS